MKKWIVCILGALTFVSCQDQVGQLSGTYSYKISGSVVIDGDTSVLSDETGAMQLLRVNSDSALLTFNALLGPVYTTSARINGKQIKVLPYERNLTHRLMDYTITGSGDGTVYDETIVFSLQYSDTTADLKAEKLTMVCKKN